MFLFFIPTQCMIATILVKICFWVNHNAWFGYNLCGFLIASWSLQKQECIFLGKRLIIFKEEHLGESDTNPIELVQASLSLFSQNGDQIKSWSTASNIRLKVFDSLGLSMSIQNF